MYCAPRTPVTVRGPLYKPPVKDGRHIGTAPELTANPLDSDQAMLRILRPRTFSEVRYTVQHGAMPGTALHSGRFLPLSRLPSGLSGILSTLGHALSGIELRACCSKGSRLGLSPTSATAEPPSLSPSLSLSHWPGKVGGVTQRAGHLLPTATAELPSRPPGFSNLPVAASVWITQEGWGSG